MLEGGSGVETVIGSNTARPTPTQMLPYIGPEPTGPGPGS